MKKMVSLFAALLLSTLAFSASAQNDWQSRKNRENAATSGSSISNNGGRWDAKVEAEREAIARQRPFAFTHCDNSYCYDNGGGVWHRNGADYLHGPNGRTCSRSGTFWNCN